MYLNLRDLDKVIDLYRQSQEKGFVPTWRLVSNYLEAGMRKEDSAVIIDGLQKFVEIEMDPHHKVLKKLGEIKHMPDKLYMLLKANFRTYGVLQEKVRQFEKPKSPRRKATGADGINAGIPDFKKRTRLKKRPTKTYSKKERKVMDIL